jgi:hypothetical protein
MSKVLKGDIADSDGGAVAHSARKSGWFLGVRMFKTAALGALHEKHVRQVDGRCKVIIAWRCILDAWKVLRNVCSGGVTIGGGVAVHFA